MKLLLEPDSIPHLALRVYRLSAGPCCPRIHLAECQISATTFPRLSNLQSLNAVIATRSQLPLTTPSVFGQPSLLSSSCLCASTTSWLPLCAALPAQPPTSLHLFDSLLGIKWASDESTSWTSLPTDWKSGSNLVTGGTPLLVMIPQPPKTNITLLKTNNNLDFESLNKLNKNPSYNPHKFYTALI